MIMLAHLRSTTAMLFTTFRMRIARNRRSRFRTAIDAVDPGRVRPARPTQRRDAAIDRTELPVGLRQMGRTVRASLRVCY